jgi:hypothetical protein
MMKSLQSLIPKQLSTHKLGAATLGAFMLDVVKGFCNYPDWVTGYLRHAILFVSVDSREDKLWLYHQKQAMLSKIAEQMQQFGYSYLLKEVRIK